jgi:hypothetical protein
MNMVPIPSIRCVPSSDKEKPRNARGFSSVQESSKLLLLFAGLVALTALLSALTGLLCLLAGLLVGLSALLSWLTLVLLVLVAHRKPPCGWSHGINRWETPTFRNHCSYLFRVPCVFV